MADVLLMPTLQLSNPIRLLISVETSDFARLTLEVVGHELSSFQPLPRRCAARREESDTLRQL
jgi:hypothetical protein